MAFSKQSLIAPALSILLNPIGMITAEAKPSIEREVFGKTPGGTLVDLYTLVNDKGVEAKIMTYGGIIVSLNVPDRNGELGDVVLGYDNLRGYLKNNPYFGAVVGRFANRIAQGRFVLDGKKYELARNDGENHLHGGIKGFDKVIWKAKALEHANNVGLRLSYLSRYGEEDYPGNLRTTVTYTLTNNNELRIDYSATTDKKTIVNLTQHSYFNLVGSADSDILKHRMMLNANRFTPVDEELILTGELQNVKGTPMDFTKPTVIGVRINQADEQLRVGLDYDHNWVLNKAGNGLTLAARAFEPSTGRVMEVYTTEPGIQFYSGNFLDGTITGKGGTVYHHRDGICLETQHFPNSPNKPHFPSVVLDPDRAYKQTTIYKFSVK
ncbi:MAG: galactose mutarotase [Pseudomonadota bacterium]|nr:galactose mutarotase [Pseudomonadota bacterium]